MGFIDQAEESLGIDFSNFTDIGKCDWFINYAKIMIKSPFERSTGFYDISLKLKYL